MLEKTGIEVIVAAIGDAVTATSFRVIRVPFTLADPEGADT